MRIGAAREGGGGGEGRVWGEGGPPGSDNAPLQDERKGNKALPLFMTFFFPGAAGVMLHLVCIKKGREKNWGVCAVGRLGWGRVGELEWGSLVPCAAGGGVWWSVSELWS